MNARPTAEASAAEAAEVSDLQRCRGGVPVRRRRVGDDALPGVRRDRTRLAVATDIDWIIIAQRARDLREPVLLFDWAGTTGRTMHDVEAAVEAVETLAEPFDSFDICHAIRKQARTATPLTVAMRVLHDLRVAGLIVPVTRVPNGNRRVGYVRRPS